MNIISMSQTALHFLLGALFATVLITKEELQMNVCNVKNMGYSVRQLSESQRAQLGPPR